MMVAEAAVKFEEAKALFAKGEFGAFLTGCLMIGRLHEEWYAVAYEGKPGTKKRAAEYEKGRKLYMKICEAQAAVCLVSFGAACYQAWKG